MTQKIRPKDVLLSHVLYSLHEGIRQIYEEYHFVRYSMETVVNFPTPVKYCCRLQVETIHEKHPKHYSATFKVSRHV